MEKNIKIFLITTVIFYLRYIYLNSNIYHMIYKEFKYISYIMFALILYLAKFFKKKDDKYFILKIMLFILFRFIYRYLIPKDYLKNNLYHCNDIIFYIGTLLFYYINI